eukprot:g11940.t1
MELSAAQKKDEAVRHDTAMLKSGRKRRMTDRFGFYVDGARGGKQISRRPSRIQVFLETKREQKWRKMLEQNSAADGGAAQVTHANQRSARQKKVLKRRVRKGIPNSVRSHAWWSLSGAQSLLECCNKNDEPYYNNLCKTAANLFKNNNPVYVVEDDIRNSKEYAVLHKHISDNYKWDNVIKEDLTRTFPNHILFDVSDKAAEDVSQKAKAHRTLVALQRLLRCYGLSNKQRKDLVPKVGEINHASDSNFQYFGYTQGMNFIAGMFLSYMPEDRAFYMLKNVMEAEHYNMAGLYSNKTPLIPLSWFIAESLLKKHLPSLHRHFQKENIVPSMFITEWVVTFYTRSFPFNFVVRVWDIFLYEKHWKIFYRVALALLKYFKKQFLESDFEQIMTLFRSIPIKVAADSDKFIQTATRRMSNGYYGDETGQVADDIIQLALKIKVKRKDIDDLKRQFDEDKDGHSRKYL